MTVQRRYAIAALGTLTAALLASSLIAGGAAGGRPNNRPGGGGASVGAMRSSAPAGMGAARQSMGGRPSNQNAMTAMPPTGGMAGMASAHAGMTGMQSAAARPNLSMSRPDLGMRGSGMSANNPQNFAQSRPQPTITTRPPFNAPPRQNSGANLAAAGGPGSLSGIARPGSTAQAANRPAGLAPAIRPAVLSGPGNSQLAGNQAGIRPGSRPAFPGNRPSIGGSGTNGSLAGLTRPGSSIPNGRPDLGGGTAARPDIAFKPDISNPNNAGQIMRPHHDFPGDNRPGWANDPRRPGELYRPNTYYNAGGNSWGGNRPWNNWTSNNQTAINNSPTIINTGYRPGFAVPGYGYGYQGNWGYGQRCVYDNSWQSGPGWAPAYGALHDNWCHGTWNNGNANWLNTAAAAGWLTNWTFGSRQYQWGYSSYSNPYYSSMSQATAIPYNYSQPINTESPPPAQEQTATATATLDQARDAFKDGDYSQALSLADRVLTNLPNDPTVHEFRALALFALGRFDEASQTLYPVLSVGPGWDWTTMSGLYSSVDTYERQLSALENYVQSHPDAASLRFLLAYHYLTIGSVDAATNQLRTVVQLKPADSLSRQMLSLLDSAKKPATIAEQIPPQSTAQATPPPASGGNAPASEIPPTALVGAWSAQPDDKTSIKLTLQPDGKFLWDVAQQQGQNQLRGSFSIGDGDLLTLAQDQQGGTLAGNVALAENGRFTFRLVGALATDPGLTFVRQL